MSVDFYKEFGELGYLANYSNHGFYEDGVFYKTVEHYYQAKKYDNPTIIKKILEADTPKEASIIDQCRLFLILMSLNLFSKSASLPFGDILTTLVAFFAISSIFNASIFIFLRF